jgi:hypothetical protein
MVAHYLTTEILWLIHYFHCCCIKQSCILIIILHRVYLYLENKKKYIRAVLRIRIVLSRIPAPDPNVFSSRIPDPRSYMKSVMKSYFFSCFFSFQDKVLVIVKRSGIRDPGFGKISSRIQGVKSTRSRIRIRNAIILRHQMHPHSV